MTLNDVYRFLHQPVIGSFCQSCQVYLETCGETWQCGLASAAALFLLFIVETAVPVPLLILMMGLWDRITRPTETTMASKVRDYTIAVAIVALVIGFLALLALDPRVSHGLDKPWPPEASPYHW